MAVESPSTLLALFAAVLGPPASAALGKLTGVLFPLATLVVCTLADASTSVVLAAEVSHNNTSPVLHISAVVANCELLNKWEEVKVVGEQILLIVGVLVIHLGNFLFTIEHGEFLANLEARNKMTLLEVRAKTAVFGDVGEELQRHEYILLPWHGCEHLRVRNEMAVEEISRDGSGGHGRLRRSSHGGTVRRKPNWGHRGGSIVVSNTAIHGAAVGDVEGAGFLVRLGDCGCSQIKSGTGKHSITVLHGDVLDPNGRLHVVGSRHFGFRRFVRRHAVSVNVIGISSRVLMTDRWASSRSARGS
jgi:hypothetical protein